MIFLCSCFKNIEKINKYIINESHVEGEGLKYSERGGGLYPFLKVLNASESWIG